MVSVFAIVVVHNGLNNNWLHQCLSSLQKSTIPVNIIAVDNASQDESVRYIENHFKQVVVLKANKNIGFGQANNMGIKVALDNHADYVFLLNQDATVEPNTIELLIKAHHANTNFGIVSPLHLNGTGNTLDFGFVNYVTKQYNAEKLLADALLQQLKDTLYTTNFVNAAAWLVSKECLRKVGGFSPSFFHYGEDYNYAQRVLYWGLEIGIYPFAKIYHDRAENRNSVFESKLLLQQRKDTIHYSAPGNTLSITKDIQSVKKLIKRFTLKLNFEKVKTLKEQLAFLQTHQQAFEKNLKASVEGKEYVFLYKAS